MNFYIVILILMASIMLNISRSPIRSIIYLIFIFLLSVILLINLGAEFLAVVLFIVYVGAISILFLFVIMMLNIRVVDSYSKIYIPIGSFIGLFIIYQIIILLYQEGFSIDFYLNLDFTLDLDLDLFNKIYDNISLIGILLFNYYFPLFLIVSLLLLVSMIGTIILTTDFRLFKYENLNYTKNVVFWSTK